LKIDTKINILFFVQITMNKIIENIENNIHGRHEADKVMLALEIITRMPNTFLKLVNAGSFFWRQSLS